MTNELEKQFFDTFGIEPKIRFHCANSQPCAHTGFHCKSCTYHSKDVIYPQITDRILLELICIAHTSPVITFCSRNVVNLKNEVLNVLCNYIDSRDIKHQVRTLFEEG